ncbi:MAG TPA: bifunctional 4-hydroxy-3-methylbut-2-enyl diphosphate reductase/30S ribosomal protein S1 [Patescibacteria group bacterium]|nr:bifunctional 4-hydroxy-3-methylbut-2-enyl diphosphate reductase/30S ribosomal protein S1 [Patescibacteria group bacterium]
MEIITAAYSGFCYGVKRAVNLTLEAVSNDSPRPVRTLGPIIHNPQMVSYLESKGVRVTDDVTAVTEGTLIIRSHGVGPEIYRQAEERRLLLLDATCPHVKKAQLAAKKLTVEGYQVVIAGERDHPEVRGIQEWSGNCAVVVENTEEAAALPVNSRLALIAQTTFSATIFQEITAVLRRQCEELHVESTICTATDQRRKAAIELAGQVEVIVVAGGKNSANTARLAQACRDAGCRQVYLVETAAELQPAWFNEAKKAGITAGASTPDWIIEEVKQTMEKFNETEAEEEKNTQNESGDFIAHIKTEAIVRLETGTIIPGKVVGVRKDEVFVDIGYKGEGRISLAELDYPVPENAADVISEGQLINVLVLDADTDVNGHVTLSKIQADRIVAWEELEKAVQDKTPVEAKITGVIKGGLNAAVFGLRAFIPASQSALRFVEDLQPFVGQTFLTLPIELDQSKQRIVLSRKAILAEEQEKKEQEILARLQPGTIIAGTVTRLADFGAFVDVGGMDGLVHISDLAWQRVKTPAEVVTVGDAVQVVVLKVDPAAKRISLSLKQVERDPWLDAVDEYNANDLLPGTVTKIAKFGAFVELKKGVEGLVHLSELSDRRVASAEEVVSEGQKVTVKILSVDKQNKKISLSMSQAQQDKERAEFQQFLDTQPQSGTLTLGDQFAHLFKKQD